MEAERNAACEAAGQMKAALAAALARTEALEEELHRARAACAAEAAEAALMQRMLGQGRGWRARLLRRSGLVELARHAARRRRWAQAERFYRLVLRA
jgi:hypothetical protein